MNWDKVQSGLVVFGLMRYVKLTYVFSGWVILMLK